MNPVDQTTSITDASFAFAELNRLKQDIIQQAIQPGEAMIEPLTKTVQNAYNKFFFKKKADEHILSTQDMNIFRDT